MSKLNIANFRGWLDDAKLKYFLSILDRKAKKYIKIYLAQQSTEQSILAAKTALRERFKDKNKKVRNFNKVLVLKQNNIVREIQSKKFEIKV